MAELDQGINLDQPQATPQVDLDLAQQAASSVPLNPQAVKERSDSASFGLTDKIGIAKDEFHSAIQNGQENQIRIESANRIDGIRQQIAKKMIDTYGYNLDDNTLQTMLQASDPKSVFEEHYADAWMQHVFWPRNPDTLTPEQSWYPLMNAFPEEWSEVAKKAKGDVAKDEYIRGRAQEIDYSNTWYNRGSPIWQNAQELLMGGFYSEATLRTNVAGTPLLAGVGLGEHIAQQRLNLYDLPYDKFKEEVDATIQSLPRDQQAFWLSNILDRSNTQETLFNLFSYAIGIGAFGKVGKNIAGRVGRYLTPAERTDMFSRGIKSISDMTAPRNPNVPPAEAAPSMAGDVKTAATERVVQDELANLNPNNNPLDGWKRRLTGNFDIDKKAASDAPGSYGRELSIRISNMMDKMRDNIMFTAEDLKRVDSNPTTLIKDRADKIKEFLVGKYSGPDNKVLNASEPFYVPGTNVRALYYDTGTADAEMFKNINEARADANRDGYVVMGDYMGTPEEVRSYRRLENLVQSHKTNAALATTEAGRNKALSMAANIQKRLDAVPKHTTGVTIENVPTFGYTSPIGPIAPSAKRMAAIAALDERISSALRSNELQIKETKNSRTLEQTLLHPDRRLAELEKRTGGTYLKSDIPTIDELENTLGRHATYDEIGQALKERDLSTLTQGKPPIQSFSIRKRGKDYPGIGGDEHILQYNIRKKMEREWTGLSPEQREQYTKTGGRPLQQTPAESVVSPTKITYEYGDTFPGLKSEIKQQGNGYFIRHYVYIPERTNIVRDGILTHDVGKMTTAEFRQKVLNSEVSTGIPPSWGQGYINAILGRLRGPGDRLSIAENLNRQIATHGPNVLLQLIRKEARPIQQIPRRHWSDFNRMLHYGQNEEMWFDSPAQIEDFYQRNFQRAPSQSEIMGYFVFKELMLGDLEFRNLAVMRNKIVLGAKQHAVNYLKDGTKTSSPFFEGVERYELPTEGTILRVNHSNPNKSTFSWADYAFRKDRALVEEDIKEGRAKLIQVFNPPDRPLKDIHLGYADYVLSYSNQEKPLGFDHVNRKGGGHLVPKGQFYIKSANVVPTGTGKWSYYGDKTLLNFKTRYEAEEALPYMERVRELLARYKSQISGGMLGDLERWEGEGGALARPNYLELAADQASRTGMPFSKIYDWYFGKNGAPPMLNVNEPLYTVKAGQKIKDLPETTTNLSKRYPFLRDTTRGGTLLSQSMVEFTQERDLEGLYTLKSIGTEQNPLFRMEPAEFLDPITAMNRGLGHIVDSLFMQDMKQYSMEHWIEQAKPYLKGDERSIRDNMLQHFYNPDYRPIDYNIKGQLEANRLQALDFVGIPSTFENSYRDIMQKFADHIYNNGLNVGVARIPFKSSVAKRFILEPLYNLPRLSSGTALLRNVAFHASQFGLKEFFTQASSLNNILWVAGPRYAYKGTAAATLYAYWKGFSNNPAALEGLDQQLAKYFWWRPGEFKNAVKLIESSGYGIVGKEHSLNTNVHSLGLNTMGSNMNPSAIFLRTASNYGRNFLDWGTTAMKWGSEVTRRASFFTSYLEHLDRMPARILERNVQSSILQRATLLDANMTSAMSSKLHTGFMSIPMQFQGYEIRMTEMMFGSQLTRSQKMRLFAGNSMMYGIRGGYLALLGIGIGDTLVKKLQDMGYVPGHNGLLDLLVNGFPSWAFAYLSGAFDAKGEKTWIDLSNWGNRGVVDIDKFIDSDPTMLEMIGGMAGNKFFNTWRNTAGIRNDIYGMMTGEGGSIKPDADDVLQVFKEISLVQDIDRTLLAQNMGRWYTKNGTYVTDVGKIQAWAALLTGVQPGQARNVWSKVQIEKDIDANTKQMTSLYNQEIMRAARDEKNDYEEGVKYHTMKAGVILTSQIPQSMWERTVKNGWLSAGISLDDRVNEKLMKLKNDIEWYQNQYRK